ncbi:DgyrCDS307 [Dimorphilus gyrociliatus]|uniref:DgyrCDS307 n=1 Tax=Dimorphilus gyrociliatus TaxID=2664684 RepID=A0A7I8V5P1_9ANNE|nr:DgyrCDS307 [Dimorphilus gyrociliatus]
MADEKYCSKSLSSPIIFESKDGQKITLTPYLINFKLSKLDAKLHKESYVTQGVLSNDLLHSVAALYSVSLPEMSPDTIYDHLSDHAKTIVLIQDENEVVQSYPKQITAEEEPKPDLSNLKPSDDKDTCPVYESPPNFFKEVFSDKESEEEEEETEEDEEDEEDFSEGCNKFIRDVVHRRQNRRAEMQTKGNENFGIETRIAAALTFNKTYINKGQETVHHLKYLATRLKYRKKFGIGKYLLNLIKDNTICGKYDAIVVHADNDATGFFLRYGFTDDVILNSRFKDLMEQFTNCTLMSYLPSFTDDNRSEPGMDLADMDRQINKWRSKAVEHFQEQSVLYKRMQREIIHLKAITTSQQTIINQLQTKCDLLLKQKLDIEREYLQYRIKADRSDSDFDDEDTRNLIKALEKYEVKWNLDDDEEMYCHGKDSEEFYAISLKFRKSLEADPEFSLEDYQVQSISKAQIKDNSDKGIEAYLVGSTKNSSRILSDGFIEEDYTESQDGKALLFTKYPSVAIKSSNHVSLYIFSFFN